MIIPEINSNLKNISFLLILSIIINPSISSILFSYPYALSLSNGNILVIHKSGIDICDHSLSRIIENISVFEGEEEINNDKALSKVTAETKDEYIFCIINDKIYIFNNIGKLLYQSNNKILVMGEKAEYYTLVIIKKANDCYYYMIGYIHNNLLYFLYYKFITYSLNNVLVSSRKGKKHEQYDDNIYLDSYYIENNLLTCQYMIDRRNYNVIVCFFLIYTSSYEIVIDYFNINSRDIIEMHSNFYADHFTYSNISCIKSTLMPERNKALVGIYTSSGDAKFFIFDIIKILNEDPYMIALDQHCRKEFHGLKINYYKEKNVYSYSCIDDNGKIFASFLNENLEIYNSTIKYNDCEDIHGYSILYSTYDEQFYVVSDVNCQGKNYPLNLIYGDIIEKENEIIKETIIENKEKEEEEIEEKNGEKEAEIEKEVECKELEKCQICNEESLLENLCIKCNNIKGYYLLKNESKINNYIDCSNNLTKPLNYYFNEENQDYEPCYNTCTTCNYGGNSHENNCTSCEINYIKNPDFNDTMNCVAKCQYFYYYSSFGEYKCSPSNKCPDDNPLLIKEKGKCIDNCMNDNIYKYQYNGECLKECPNNTSYKDNEYICTDIDNEECKELEKCELCNKESISKNLCIKCNNKKGYYFLNNNIDLMKSENNKYIDCVNNSTKPSNFYFYEEEKEFRICYEVCATCDYGGNGNKNNCTSCEANYILKPDIPNSTDCVLECLYYYYYTSYNQYRCTDNLICPENYNLLIVDKKKCTDNCQKENIYKYQYNGMCLIECPNGTITNGTNDYTCKDKNIDKCVLSENKINYLDDNITDSEIEAITKNFAREFQYTDNHISLYKNNIYSIIIYKNSDCIFELSLEFPEIDFGECERKVKINNQINGTLIIAIITKNINGNKNEKIISYSLHDPTSGKKLFYDDICKDDTVTFQENLLLKLDNKNTDIDSLLHIANQNINIFNLSSEFYTDICYQFESPIDKDIALKDRILLFYPNITLCQEGCNIQGVNLTSFKAICECKLKDKNNNIFQKNLVIQSQVGEIESLISGTNIAIIKCYKVLFNYKYFLTFLGGYIILILLLIQIILTFIYYKRSLYLLKKYIFNITDKYIVYLAKQKINELSFTNSLEFYNNIIVKNNAPPKRKLRLTPKGENENTIRKEQKAKTKIEKKRTKSNRNKKKMTFIKNIDLKNLMSNSNYQINLSNDSNQDKTLISNSEKVYTKPENNKKMSKDGSYFNKEFNKKNLFVKSKIIEDSYIKDYLKTDLDDMDFDDALKKDNRKFCDYLNDKLKANQNIMNTFYTIESLRPRTIKIILFILYIDLYLLVNGLFFNEEYISEVFHSNKEENFFTFIPRSIERIFYTTLVRGIIGYIMIFIFVEEKKIKGIFKREKDSIIILKYQITQVLKSIISRFNYFIIASFIIVIFTIYYSFCFNYIYPHMIEEWIKSSFVIIFIMQLISVFSCCLETIIRYIGFKCKSEKLFKISLLFS